MNKTFSPVSRQNIPAQSGSRLGNAAAFAIALLVSAMPMARALIIETNTLTINPPGVFNLKNNVLIVRSGNFATIKGYVVNGFTAGPNGYWDGQGINSSSAAADPDHLTGLGIINNAEAQFTSFEGRPTLLGTETFVKYTLYGDANLDGQVDGADLALMGLGTCWYHGDFNYDETVDAVDYALFEAGRASQTGNVPEPGSLSLLIAGVAGLAGRRRK